MLVHAPHHKNIQTLGIRRSHFRRWGGTASVRQASPVSIIAMYGRKFLVTDLLGSQGSHAKWPDQSVFKRTDGTTGLCRFSCSPAITSMNRSGPATGTTVISQENANWWFFADQGETVARHGTESRLDNIHPTLSKRRGGWRCQSTRRVRPREDGGSYGWKKLTQA